MLSDVNRESRAWRYRTKEDRSVGITAGPARYPCPLLLPFVEAASPPTIPIRHMRALSGPDCERMNTPRDPIDSCGRPAPGVAG